MERGGEERGGGRKGERKKGKEKRGSERGKEDEREGRGRGERDDCSLVCLLIRTITLMNEGPTLLTSLNLNYFFYSLHLQIHTGDIWLQHMSWGEGGGTIQTLRKT